MENVPLVILFDATCGLCNRSAAWLAQHNTKGRLLFAPNQGVTANLANEPMGGEEAGLVVWQGSRRHVGVPAITAALKALGGIWLIAGWILDALPSPLVNLAYTFIATRRRSLSAACGPVVPFKADLD